MAADLNAKLARPVDGPAGLGSILNSVFAAHKQEGLHSLAVKPTGPGAFDVLRIRLCGRKRGKR